MKIFFYFLRATFLLRNFFALLGEKFMISYKWGYVGSRQALKICHHNKYASTLSLSLVWFFAPKHIFLPLRKSFKDFYYISALNLHCAKVVDRGRKIYHFSLLAPRPALFKSCWKYNWWYYVKVSIIKTFMVLNAMIYR